MTKTFIMMIMLLLPISTEAKTVFVGDSISYGMAKYSNNINSGIVGSGLTVGNPHKNYKHWEKYSKNNKVVVEIGTNDYSYKGYEYGKLLSQYILPLSNKDNICIVSVPNPLHRNIIQKGVSNINPQIKEWAKNNNIKYITFPEYYPNEKIKDGIHFKPKSYKRLAIEIIKKCSE